MNAELTTTCGSCYKQFEALMNYHAEQKGGPDTEYIPEHWELDSRFCPHCNIVLPHLQRANLSAKMQRMVQYD